MVEFVPARRRRDGRGPLVAAVAAVTALAAACVPPPGDSTPPDLQAPTTADFVVGSQVSRGSALDESSEFTNGIAARVEWSGSDAGSGICGYDVDRVFAGAEPQEVLSGTTATSYEDSESDYDDQFGGGSFKLVGWDVTARDCAGNETTRFVDGGPAAMQEDGTTAGFPVDAPTYTGTWLRSTCECWSGGAVLRTSEAGATMTFTNNGWRRVALVMPQAANRGRARVLVDGVERAVVDTGSSTTTNRTVVWTTELGPDSVVQVVNEGTEGRPRIDVDAVLVR